MNQRIERFTHHLTNEAIRYLKQEVKLTQVVSSNAFADVKNFVMRDFTALISVADKGNVLIAFSLDETMLKAILVAFIEDDACQPEEEEYLDMAGEFINIVIGLAIKNMDADAKSATLFSPPIILHESKTIHRYKGSSLKTETISTEVGSLDIHYIAPKSAYDTQLGTSEV